MLRNGLIPDSGADSQMHPETFNAREKTLANDKIIGGTTEVKVERMSMGIWHGITHHEVIILSTIF